MQKSIYVIFTKPNTIVSRVIKFATSAPYTHVGISLDNPFLNFYSFSRKFTFLPIPAGFVRESWNNFNYQSNPNMPLCIVKLDVSLSQYNAAKEMIENFENSSKAFNYNIVGLFLCKTNVTINRSNHYFCSEFVHEVLVHSRVYPKLKHSQHVSPQEVFEMLAGREILVKGSMNTMLDKFSESLLV